MKEIWLEDAESIQQEMESLVEQKMELICGRTGKEITTKLKLVGKTTTKTGPLFILLHPHDPTCGSEECTFFYHSRGNPLRVFECKRVKKAENFVGFEYPKQIFNIHRRKFERVTTPNNSVVTFSIQRKQRIHNGAVGDISLEGAKLLVNLPGVIEKGVILCHIALTVYYRISKVQTSLTIPEAEVIWTKCENDVTHTVGIKFVLSEKDTDALSNYIDLRGIEDSYKRP